MKFRAIVELNGKTATGIQVPATETRLRRIAKAVEKLRERRI